MSKLQWAAIIVVLVTALGVAYYMFAVFSPSSSTPTTTVETLQTETAKPVKPGTDSKKANCGNGVCTAPENTNNCPVDCN